MIDSENLTVKNKNKEINNIDDNDKNTKRKFIEDHSD